MCPRHDESAGKKRSTRMRKGSRWLKQRSPHAPGRPPETKGSYFHAQFHRIKARRGGKKAIGAVVASLLRAIYPMLKDRTLYQDLGATTSTDDTRPPPPAASRTSGSPFNSLPSCMIRV
jgi:transposase